MSPFAQGYLAGTAAIVLTTLAIGWAERWWERRKAARPVFRTTVTGQGGKVVLRSQSPMWIESADPGVIKNIEITPGADELNRREAT